MLTLPPGAPPPGSLPPPPEVPQHAVLAWQRPGEARPQRQVPSHPLFCLAEPEPAPTRSRGPRRRWTNLPPVEMTRRLLAAGSGDRIPLSAGGRPASDGGRGAGRPLVLMVAGGRGGSGRSTLALDIAWAISSQHGGHQTLLVDADEFSPSLDLRLGAAEEDLDRLPSARVDQVLLRLPDLTTGNPRLEGILWTDPQHSLRALFSTWPGREAPAVGSEHLDYLLQYLIQPAFEVVVVDGGPRPGANGSQARFWASRSNLFLLPLRPSPAHARSACQVLQVLEKEFGVGPDRCRGVVALAPGESIRRWHRQPALEGLALWPRPWAQRSAALAEARHLPLAQVDRKVATATANLAADLWAATGEGWPGG